MSWEKKTGPEGGPIWAGRDAIANPFAAREKALYNLAGCAVLGVGGVAAIGSGAWVAGSLWEALRKARWDWLMFMAGGELIDLKDPIAFAVFFLVVGLIGWGCWKVSKHPEIAPHIGAPSGFFEREWSLTAVENGCLSYVAGQFSDGLDWQQVGPLSWWAVVDQIARVEVGRTAEWQGKRYYPGGPIYSQGGHDSGVIFSDGSHPLARTDEYQAFLFMADGSRQVIYTVNGGREQAATLAASVRSWLEAYRASASIAAPLAVASILAPTALPHSRCDGFDV